MQARRWASKTFLSEAAMPNVHLCYKRSKKQKKKSSRQGAIKSVAILPILLSWKLKSNSSVVQKTPRTSGMLPILPLHLLEYLSTFYFSAVHGNGAWVYVESS